MTNLLRFKPTVEPGQASLTVIANEMGDGPISPRLWGKFCEHLGANIYHGMEAQILFNCTLSKWRFSAGDDHPDGGVREESDREKIVERIATYAQRYDWPAPEAVIDAYLSGGAYGWFKIGDGDTVRLSPDVGPHAGRAQRIELLGKRAERTHGIGQWTHLPLHRTHAYPFRIVARSMQPCKVTLSLSPVGSQEPVTQAVVALTESWQTLTGTLQLPDGAPEADLYTFALTAAGGDHIVVDRVLIYPSDHVNGADPDIIAELRAAHLPLLRWPGGNFVSGYHWRDGVGPVDARPTLPNPAWEGLEFNLFGTDEFLAFCREVGCEPMICVNAGNGTADEAAAWVEYCNGATDTPMGRLRAANGHPEPYSIRYWEIGNEIYGRWQVGWTTPAGNADRYARFRKAMLGVDPSLTILGCGHGNEPNSEWNRTLIEATGPDLTCITDHILTGGSVDAETDPVELYHAFMGYPDVLKERYRTLQEQMQVAGNSSPHLAITELQLFAHFRGETKPEGGMRPELLPRPDTIAEALSLSMIVNTLIRMGSFVELLTHSATVNHGGGLRKQRERVYANPVHYAHALGFALAGGHPVAVDLACETFDTEHSFAHIPPQTGVPVLDAMAVLTEMGELVLLLVHRSATCGVVKLTVTLEDFEAAADAEIVTLRGDTWHDRNTLDEPDRIVPHSGHLTVRDGRHLDLQLAPYSILRITLKGT